MNDENINYGGYELGPIRPPSESSSLLIRITRNCPWNKCRFCTLYKGTHFSVRKKEDVKEDLRLIRLCIDFFEQKKDDRRELFSKLGKDADYIWSSAFNWYKNGMKSVFIQDANSMVIKADDMVEILQYLRELFPNVNRVTCYGRAHTIARISDEDMGRFAKAGMNRIHIGMETGSDVVLGLVDKGTDKESQVIAGRKVKAAGIQLSEYYMPGLGGKEYSKENALETADALNKINPDFIRLRTLALTENSLLKKDYDEGVFTRSNDTEMVEELLFFIKTLDGIDSYIKSDHIINLIPDVEGRLPEDKEKMISAIEWYLELPESEKLLYRAGRRLGYIGSISDYKNPVLKERIFNLCKQYNINNKNADEIMDHLMNRYV